MCVYVREADAAAGRPPRAEQASQNNAAVAAENDDESSVRRASGDAFGERSRIHDDLFFVSGSIRRPHVIAVRRRTDVSKIPRAKPMREPALAQHARRSIELPRLPVVVGTDSDARGRSDQDDGTVHGSEPAACPGAEDAAWIRGWQLYDVGAAHTGGVAV